MKPRPAGCTCQDVKHLVRGRRVAGTEQMVLLFMCCPLDGRSCMHRVAAPTPFSLPGSDLHLQNWGFALCRAVNVLLKRLDPEKTNRQPGPRLPRARISSSECIVRGKGLYYRSSCFGLSPRPTNVNISHSSGIILGPGSSTLFLERVTEEDEGVYRCTATNQKGSVESSAYLTVQGKQRLQRATRSSSDVYFPV